MREFSFDLLDAVLRIRERPFLHEDVLRHVVVRSRLSLVPRADVRLSAADPPAAVARQMVPEGG